MSTEVDTDGLTGQTLRGVYLVQEKIAEGKMGAVYKAVHTALDAPFAVKVLRRELQPDATVVARFQRDARALSRLRHPNVVAVTDFGQTESGTLFVVMEYVTGKSLARIIADDAPLPEHRVVRIGAQILAALTDAHARQVLHGSLTPGDVMIESRRDPPDSVKVLDFGVAGMQLLAQRLAAAESATALDSLAYASPEQLAGGDVDARSDLFSVGVLLYEMLTGTLPYADLDRGRLAEPPPPPSARLRRPVSSDLEALVMRALQPHAYERPDGAAEMRDELLRCRIALEDATEDELGPTVVLPRQQPAAERAPSQPPRTPTPAATQRAAATPGRSTPARATPQRATPAASSPRATARPPSSRATPPRATPAPTATVRAVRETRRAVTPGAARLSAAVLADIERRAVPILGPVAPFLVAKAGAVATSPEDLCDIVASFIPSEKDRAAFLAATGTAKRTATVAAPERGRSPVAWDPDLLERAQRALATHIGPVARVVVRRASATARDPEHLCELLAQEIGDEAGRSAFRRALRTPDRGR